MDVSQLLVAAQHWLVLPGQQQKQRAEAPTALMRKLEAPHDKRMLRAQHVAGAFFQQPLVAGQGISNDTVQVTGFRNDDTSVPAASPDTEHVCDEPFDVPIICRISILQDG